MDETPTALEGVLSQPVAPPADMSPPADVAPPPQLPAAAEVPSPLPAPPPQMPPPAEMPTLMPPAQASPPPASRRRDDTGDSHRSRRIAGIILILVGLLFYAQYFLPALSWATLWPAILIVIGAYVLLKGRRS